MQEGPPWAVDAWGLGILMQEAFSNTPMAAVEQLRNTQVPAGGTGGGGGWGPDGWAAAHTTWGPCGGAACGVQCGLADHKWLQPFRQPA